MKNPVRIAAYLVTFIAGMWGGNELIKQLSNNSEGSQVAQAMIKLPAPEFNLPDVNGVLHNSHEWDGKVVILNFWATWCPPCVKETPTFVDLQEQYATAGVQFVGIAIDKKDAVLEFMDTYGVDYPMLIGEDDAINISRDYGNRYGALPYTVVINRQGQIHFVQRGEMTRENA
ncbi:MAG: TlpA family protein disulfide reductase, partial [Gammaproteobacteria bacterium]|nr:TlpA family protein disulfide reductase [Gammaproteobacteria bacterium]